MKPNCVIAVCWLCCSVAFLASAQGNSKKVSIHQVPAGVKKTIETEVADGKLDEIERDDEEGEVSYTVNRTRKDGQERQFTVAEDGTLLSVEVSMEETPPAVQKTIKAQIGRGTLGGIEKAFEENEISYDVEMTRKEGGDRSFTVGPDGKLLSVQMTLDEVPPAVRKTIEAHTGTGKLGDIYRLVEGAEVSYDAELHQDGKVRDVIVSPKGQLESIQVSLADVPAEAQKTIKEKVGNGKIIRIDKSFTPQHGVLPYDVEARKDGRPLDFRVGPKGRLLGTGK